LDRKHIPLNWQSTTFFKTQPSYLKSFSRSDYGLNYNLSLQINSTTAEQTPLATPLGLRSMATAAQETIPVEDYE